MRTEKFKATTAELVENKVKSPFPLSVIPNYMGINLCSIDSLEWERLGDGQLVSLTINFIPAKQTVSSPYCDGCSYSPECDGTCPDEKE